MEDDDNYVFKEKIRVSGHAQYVLRVPKDRKYHILTEAQVRRVIKSAKDLGFKA
jgi:hypothetical protein